MKVSSRVDYALSCLLRVADKYAERRLVTIREVGEKERIETDYVEQLFIAMKRAGILKSVRGKAGGYVLNKPAHKITVKDVVVAINKEVLKIICHRKKGRRNKCIHSTDCKIRILWEGLRDDMELFLEKYTIEKLLTLRRKEKKWR